MPPGQDSTAARPLCKSLFAGRVLLPHGDVMKANPLVTLLTDFGTADGYVAAMKGVVLDQCPQACVVDAAHDLPRHDVRAAAWVLRQYGWTFPAGTIHVAVVDPGVGTERAALVVEVDGQIYVGPDNGLFAWVLKRHPQARVLQLKAGIVRPGGNSATFHGRDVFAYAAGLLAKGIRLDRLAEPVDTWFQPEWVNPVLHGRVIEGEVIHVDHFGNLITNIPASLVVDRGPEAVVKIGKRTIKGIVRTYAEVPVGHPLALVGSDEMLEVAVNQGDASLWAKSGLGSQVRLT